MYKSFKYLFSYKVGCIKVPKLLSIVHNMKKTIFMGESVNISKYIKY